MQLHVKVKIKGTNKGGGREYNEEFFKYIMSLRDSDWPFLPMKLTRALAGATKIPKALPELRLRLCETCGGFIWNAPVMSPGDVKAIGKQCGVAVKFKQLISLDSAEKCKGAK